MKEKKPPDLNFNDRIAIILATGFGSGYSPIAPGTAGTAVAIPIIYAASIKYYPWLYMMIFTLIFFIGVSVSNFGELYFKKKDPGHVNIDEIAGYFVTMFLVPINIKTLGLGFFFLRI